MERKRSVRRHRKKQTWWQKCKEYLRQFVAFLFSNVGIIGLVVGYTIAGSFIFMTTEGDRIEQMVVELRGNRSQFAKRLWNITSEMNKKAMLRDKAVYTATISRELTEYQNIVVHFTRKGFVRTDDINTSAQWSFAGAFLYSLTVITTIGYGNIYPHTPVGKIATIIYAIIGMPLFLLYLSNIGDIMARSFKWIYANCCLCRWCPGVAKRRALRKMKREQRMYVDSEDDSRRSSGSTEQNDAAFTTRTSIVSDVLTPNSEESYDVQNVTVPVTICLAIMVGYICGGALLFCKWETTWSFMDASYFCFISLSTIGFGDLVPGDKIYGRGRDFYTEVLELSFVFCSIYLMLGMALIAMCFNLMQEEVIHKSRATIRTIKHIFRCNR